MTALGKHRSLWLDTTPQTSYPQVSVERRFDVAVIGAGITGLTTALLLARGGASVAVLDQHVVGGGVTGHTTAKVTSQHGLTYASIARTHGGEAAATYAEANQAAIEQVAAFAGEGIECDFRRKPAYVYGTSAETRRLVEEEAAAATAAGIPSSFAERAPLPYETQGALRFDDQAELHPRRYLLGLARLLEEAGGEIFEHSRARQVREGDPCVVETEPGRVRADRVVVATLLPFLDRGVFFARAFPSRSYIVAARIAEPPPDGMFISAGSPTRSLRAQPHDGGELLLVGGEGHHTGAGDAQPERYERLAEFARRHWTVEAIEHHWSSQDYSPADGIPYVGRLNPLSRRIYVATGMKKWGMTAGTAAATILSDELLGRRSPWADLFSSTRLRPRAEGRELVVENARAGLHFLGDRVRERGARDIGDLRPGEGAIVSAAGRKVAGYRDEAGGLHAVSARCTHLYCQVRWNAAEHSWDCPCHGSRFGVDGEVLNGPAVRPLDKRPTG